MGLQQDHVYNSRSASHKASSLLMPAGWLCQRGWSAVAGGSTVLIHPCRASAGGTAGALRRGAGSRSGTARQAAATAEPGELELPAWQLSAWLHTRLSAVQQACICDH